MTTSTPSFLIVYFVYGFAFFSLGIALLLESQRTPSLALSKRLRPLSAFGITHGMHEWLELFVAISTMAGMPRSLLLEWLRLILLVVSFASLLAYGIQELQPAFQVNYSDPLIAGLALVFYAIVLLLLQIDVVIGSNTWFVNADALSRMLIAVPASVLAFFTLTKRAITIEREGRLPLSRYLRLASYCFILYGFSQLFVPASAILYAPWLNSHSFESFFGFPIQVPRALIALSMAFVLIRATQSVEVERQEELNRAQEARLMAAERAQEEMSKRKALQQSLLHSIVQAQEEERSRISRELHDETAQLLTALSLEIATIDKMLPESNTLQDHTLRIQEICRQISQKVNTLVHELRPALLDDLGITQALNYLVDEAKKNLGLTVTLSINGNVTILPDSLETTIFRIVQESLTNAARHSGVDSAQVCFSFMEESICLQVSDQGVGFEPDIQLGGNHRIGLLSMQERAEALGGIFSVTSEPGSGTIIFVEIPTTLPVEVEP